MTKLEIDQASKYIAQVIPYSEHSTIHEMAYAITQDLTEYETICANVDLLLEGKI